MIGRECRAKEGLRQIGRDARTGSVIVLDMSLLIRGMELPPRWSYPPSG